VNRPLASNWGYSDFDVRHVFVASHVWRIPVGRGRAYASSLGAAADGIIGGWSLSGILAVRTGSAFDVTLGADVNDDGFSNDRPALIGNASLDSIYAGDSAARTQFLAPSAQARQTLWEAANVLDPFAPIERGFYHGPTTWTYDLSVSKAFSFTERVSLNIEANAFNLFNHTNFGNPNSNLRSSFFGTVSSTVGLLNPRQIQLGVKLRF
jgi:hypothetical protein